VFENRYVLCETWLKRQMDFIKKKGETERLSCTLMPVTTKRCVYSFFMKHTYNNNICSFLYCRGIFYVVQSARRYTINFQKEKEYMIQMIQSIGILLLFCVMVYFMMRGKLTFVISLPLLALGIAVIAGVPWLGDKGILNVVFQEGVVGMASSYVAVIISAWLGAMMNNTGISKTIIKTAAELGGDKPMLVTIFMTVAVSLCYTTVAGLGSVIMIASISVPILISVGVPSLVAISIFLFSYATGLSLNMANWKYFTSLVGIDYSDVKLFSQVLMGLTALMTLAFIIIQLKRNGVKYAWAAEAGKIEKPDLDFKKAPLLSLFTPLIPIVLVIAFKVPIIPALFAGILYCFLTVTILGKGNSLGKMLGMTTKSAIDGVSDGALGVLSMIVIGMLSKALTHDAVKSVISGAIKTIFPSNMILFLVFFAVLAPLALYRGPLNVWGVGAGIATLIASMNIVSAPIVLCCFIACERMQVIGDPTNSHSVWLANYVGTDTMTLLKKVFFYVWILCVLAVAAVGILYRFM
jgi:hypothetical protein